MSIEEQSIEAGEIWGWCQREHPFDLGQPLYLRTDVLGDTIDVCAYIAVGFFKATWSEWFVATVPENQLESAPINFPVSWMTDISPGEPRYANVIRLSDYRRGK